MKKHLVKIVVCLFVALFLLSTPVFAATDSPLDVPYESYIYNQDNEPLCVPSPYVISKTVTGNSIGVDTFKKLTDVYYDGENRLFLTDEEANMIVIVDKDYNYIATMQTFINNGAEDTFSAPKSVYVNGGKIYVADSENGRIVVFNSDTLEFLYVLGRPEIAVLPEDYSYKPTGVTVDNSGRVYVIANGINQGLICMDESGKFTNFLGAPSVEYDFLDLMWRKFTTKSQRKQQKQFVPTEYTKMLIDDRGFIYAVAESSTSTPVAKINSQGKNVLSELKNESQYGDVTYTTLLGDLTYTHFCDVTIDDMNTYYLLDSQNGRIYIYSEDGYMLFAFGSTGSQSGTFFSASSIEKVDDKILVTDHVKNAVFEFKLTGFGKNVFSALSLYNDGKYDEAENMWNTVYNTSSNYNLAIIGLAKIDIQKGEYKQAMDRVKPISEYKVYTQAFAKWRNNLLRDNFGVFVIILAAVIVVIVAAVIVSKKTEIFDRIRESKFYKEFKYGTYVMFHPFDGFWDIKREKRGSAKTATVILGIFVLFYAVRTQFTSYVVTKESSDSVNVIFEVVMILLPLLLWVVSNWCFTALMDGEGSMKDIYIATCYALKPYLLFSIPLFVLSHLITADEVVIYTVLDMVCWIWVLGLVFFGMMVTHDYSLGKSFLTLSLTLVGICLCIFIMLLFSSIVQQVYSFFRDAYKELQFRTY